MDIIPINMSACILELKQTTSNSNAGNKTSPNNNFIIYQNNHHHGDPMLNNNLKVNYKRQNRRLQSQNKKPSTGNLAQIFAGLTSDNPGGSVGKTDPLPQKGTSSFKVNSAHSG